MVALAHRRLRPFSRPEVPSSWRSYVPVLPPPLLAIGDGLGSETTQSKGLADGAETPQTELSPKAPELEASQDDISQAYARYGSANEIVLRQHGDPGVLTDEKVTVPQREPGKDEQEDAHLEAEHDI